MKILNNVTFKGFSVLEVELTLREVKKLKEVLDKVGECTVEMTPIEVVGDNGKFWIKMKNIKVEE
jgi:hypothetical protein